MEQNFIHRCGKQKSTDTKEQHRNNRQSFTNKSENKNIETCTS